MGTDGTRGSADIVAAGGGIIGQDEPTSIVWGMPGGVAQAGLCCLVLPLPDIAPAIVERVREAGVTGADYEFIRKLLKQRSGLMLSAEKQYLVESRLMPVARRNGIADLSELTRKLRRGTDAALITEVVEAMTTNETFFFRDRIPFEHFRTFIMPALMQARARYKRIRIWCAAASTGQEPYSLAMAIKEMGAALDGFRIEILATDLSTEVLQKARAGSYSQFEVQRGLPIQLLVKYFTQAATAGRSRQTSAAWCSFALLNLLDDFSRLGQFDLVVCRNVLIYFDQPTKSDVLDRMARVVAPDGFLILGAAETTIGLTQGFKSVPDRRGLYAPADPVAHPVVAPAVSPAVIPWPIARRAVPPQASPHKACSDALRRRGAASRAARTISVTDTSSTQVGAASPSAISSVVEITVVA